MWNVILSIILYHRHHATNSSRATNNKFVFTTIHLTQNTNWISLGVIHLVRTQILEKNLLGRVRKFLFWSGVLLLGSIFPEGGQRYFGENEKKKAQSQYKKQLLQYALKGSICIMELIRYIRINHWYVSWK